MAVQLVKTGIAAIVKKSSGYGAAAFAGYQLNNLFEGVIPETKRQEPIHIIQHGTTNNYNWILLLLIVILIITIIFILLVRKLSKQRKPSEKSKSIERSENAAV